MNRPALNFPLVFLITALWFPQAVDALPNGLGAAAASGPSDRIPFTFSVAGEPLAEGDIVDFGSVGPRRPAQRSLVLHNAGPEPIRLAAGDFTLDGEEFRFVQTPGGSLAAGESMTLELEATGEGRAGTEARKLIIDLTDSGHEEHTLILRRTIREVTRPCDTQASLPPADRPHGLYFEGTVYPDCEALWWTLSDEVSSHDLRAAWQSPEASVERYLEATGDLEGAQQHSFYISGRSTPHLIPMWEALIMLADRYGAAANAGSSHPALCLGETGEAQNEPGTASASLQNLQGLRSELAATGLRSQAVELVFQSLDGLHEVRAANLTEVRQNNQAMRARIRRAATVLGHESVSAGLVSGGNAALAEAAGLPLSEFQEGLRQANRYVDLELAVPRLENLLARLPLADWLALRRYLKESLVRGFEMKRQIPIAVGHSRNAADGPGSECPFEKPSPTVRYDTMVHSELHVGNEVDVAFRAIARFIGPVFLQDCYTSLATGCFMNHEDPNRSQDISVHDPDTAQFHNSGDTVEPFVFLANGDCIQCREVIGRIPRCHHGGEPRGTRHHSWIASTVSAGLQSWADESTVDETGIREVVCYEELLDVSGIINGLHQSSNVTIQLRAFTDAGVEFVQSRESRNFSGAGTTSWSFSEKVPDGGFVRLTLTPSQASRCTFTENGQTTLTKDGEDEAITEVDIDCCNTNGGSACKTRIGGQVVGIDVDDGENVFVNLHLSSGEELFATLERNGSFEFETEATVGSQINFFPDSSHNSGDLTWSNENKLCMANLESTTVELPPLPGSPLPLLTITCACVPEPLEAGGESSREGSTQNAQDCDDPIPPGPGPCDPSLPFWASPWECICVRDCVETWDTCVEDPNFPGGLVCTLVNKCTSSGGGCGSLAEGLTGPEVSTTMSTATIANGIQAVSLDVSADDPADGVAGFLVFLDGLKIHQQQEPGSGSSGTLSWGMDLSSLAPGDHTLTLQVFDDNPTQKEITFQDFDFTVEGSGNPEDPPPGEVERARLIDLELPDTMACGSEATARATFQNNGDTTWRRYGAAGGYKLGRPDGHDDPFETPFRVELPQGVEVPPGGTHTFEWTMTAPLTPGSFITKKRMVHEGRRWFGETLQGSVSVHCSSLLVSAAADAWVAQDDATSSTGGSSPELRVRYAGAGTGRFSLLRFHLPPIPGTVLGARLKIHSGPQAIPAAAFYRVDNAGWSEGSVTWNNWSDGGATYLYLRNGQSLAADTWHVIDVSEALANGSQVDLGIASSLDLEGLAFDSRESSHPPVLEVLYCPAGSSGC